LSNIVDVAIDKFKGYKLLDTHNISSELWLALIQAGIKTCSEVHKLTHYIWNKEEMPQQRKEFITVYTYKKCNKTDCTNYLGISYQLHIKLYPTFFSQG
jgi:hypothetical protein